MKILRTLLAAALVLIVPVVALAQSANPTQMKNVSISGWLSTAQLNVALLKALPTSVIPTGTQVTTTGYATAGDGGGGTYTLSASPCSLNSGAGDNGVQVKPTASSACWNAVLVNNHAPAKLFGVKCDGSTDDAAAINTAFASQATVKFALDFPAGTCAFKSTLTIGNANQTLISGAGADATKLLYSGTSTTIDLLTVGMPGYQPFGMTLQNFQMQSSTVMTAGNAIHVQHCRYCQIKEVKLYPLNIVGNNFYHGLWIDQPDLVRLDGFFITAQQDCLRVSAKGVGTGNQYDIFGINGKVANCAVGVHVGGGIDNVHFDKIMDTTNTMNVVVDNGIEAFNNQEVTFGPQFVTDQPTDSNYYINDSLCTTTYYGIIRISGLVTHANTKHGIWVKNWPNCNLIIDSPLITQNAGAGVLIDDASAYVSISPATQITQNLSGVASTALYSRLLSTGRVFGNTQFQYTGNVSISKLGGVDIAPTILTGFGTSASIIQANGTYSFTIDVGTGGTATSGALTMPATATFGWNCSATNRSSMSATVALTKLTISTPTTITLANFNSSGSNAAWNASDLIDVACTPR